MTPDRMVSDLMSTDFRTAHTQPNGPNRPASFIVLLDEVGIPLGLLGPDGEGPVLVVSANMDLVTLLTSADVLDVLEETAGVVVVQAGAVAGVVSVAALREEASRFLETSGAQLGVDSQPFGRPTDFPDPVRIACTACGKENKFEYYSQAKIYCCQHGPHDLVPSSRRGGT